MIHQIDYIKQSRIIIRILIIVSSDKNHCTLIQPNVHPGDEVIQCVLRDLIPSFLNIVKNISSTWSLW